MWDYLFVDFIFFKTARSALGMELLLFLSREVYVRPRMWDLQNRCQESRDEAQGVKANQDSDSGGIKGFL